MPHFNFTVPAAPILLAYAALLALAVAMTQGVAAPLHRSGKAAHARSQPAPGYAGVALH